MYLSEVCQEAYDAFHLRVAPSTICRLLRKRGITRKKISQVALQPHYKGVLWHTFLFKREMFLWVDETGSDALLRKFGYALQGVTPTTHRLLSRSKRISNAVAAISSTGILTYDLTDETVTGEAFFNFITGSLIPNMLPFDGINPHSIAIMDNCSVHHVQEVKQLFKDAGILLLFLPPYSLDLNPIEETFSFVKSYLRKHDELLQAIPIILWT